MLTTFLFSTILFSNVITITPEAPKIDRMELLLEKLAMCESSNNPKAIRPNDPDAPSIGLYQWKIESYVWAGRKYRLPHGDIWNPEEQKAITKALIEDDRGQQHFKNCWRKYKLNDLL